MANGNLPVGYGTTSLTAQEADVSDELGRTGVALGDLIKKTGLAVAETQNRLNNTSAESATALANTLVDVIAVEEKTYLDDGTLDSVTTHTRKLPLINFIDPAFYQWTKVRLQGQYFAREFVTDTSYSRYSSQKTGRSGQAGVFVLLGGGYNRRSFQSDYVQTTTNRTDDVAFGRIRMNVLLEPRDDATVPKPRQIIQGPRLSLIHGDIADDTVSGVLKGRTMSMLIQYHKRDGSPISGKPISIETSGLPWSHVGSTTTDSNGQMEIQLRRDFLDEEANTSPMDVVVTARIGLVQNTVTVTF